MVEYRPITDINKIKQTFSDKQFAEGYVYGAYTAYENCECVGRCLVMIDKQNCYVSDIEVSGNDSLLVEGLIRSALFFAANRSAYMAFCKQSEFSETLDLLGFEQADGLYRGDIPTLLQGSCCKGK